MAAAIGGDSVPSFKHPFAAWYDAPAQNIPNNVDPLTSSAVGILNVLRVHRYTAGQQVSYLGTDIILSGCLMLLRLVRM